MDAYRRVLGTGGVAPVLLLGFLARIPFSTLGLLLTLHCVRTLERSYLEAGLVVTATTIGTALSSPWRGRLVDTKGLRRAVLPSILVQSTAVVAMAFAPYEAVLLLALVGGLFGLPVWSIVRTSLSVLVPATLRRSAFALDSVLTEIVFMIGPAAVTVAALGIGTRACLVVVGVLVAVAGAGIAIANPPTRSAQLMIPARIPAPLEAAEGAVLAQQDVLVERRVAEDLRTGQIPVVAAGPDAPEKAVARRALLTAGGLAVLAATAIGSLILTATDLSIVAILDDAGRTAAIAWTMALWCAGSLVGGFVYGAMRRGLDSLWVLLGLGALSLPVALTSGSGMVALAVTITLAGLFVAPMITATGEAISHLVPEEVRGEAMGWHGSAMTVGAAAGSPLIGVVIDRIGPAWGVGAAGAVAVLVAAGALAARRLRRARRRARWRAGTV